MGSLKGKYISERLNDSQYCKCKRLNTAAFLFNNQLYFINLPYAYMKNTDLTNIAVKCSVVGKRCKCKNLY